jgi:hypothetical protein
MKTKLTIILFLMQLALFAQNNTVTAGATAIGTNGSLTYTIGQINYQTNNGSNGTISQGVQQAFEIVTLSTNDVPQIQLTVIIYPNPTVQNVTLFIKDFELTNLKFQLFDIQGRIISNGKITQNETEIEMTSLASAQYFLKISDSNSEIKTFKIIKK